MMSSSSQTSSLEPPNVRKSARIAAKVKAVIQEMKNSAMEIIFPALKDYKLSNDFLKQLFSAILKKDGIFVSRHFIINDQLLNDFRNEMKEKKGQGLENGREVDSVWIVVIPSIPKMLNYFILFNDGGLQSSQTIYKEECELFEVDDESSLPTLINQRKEAINKKADELDEQPSTSAVLRKENEHRFSKSNENDSELQSEDPSQQCNESCLESNPNVHSTTHCSHTGDNDNEETPELQLDAATPTKLRSPNIVNRDLEMASALPVDSVNIDIETIENELDELREYIEQQASINDGHSNVVSLEKEKPVEDSAVDMDVGIHDKTINEESLPVLPGFPTNKVEATKTFETVIPAPPKFPELVRAVDIRYSLVKDAVETVKKITASEEDSKEDEEEERPLKLVVHERSDVSLWNLTPLGRRH